MASVQTMAYRQVAEQLAAGIVLKAKGKHKVGDAKIREAEKHFEYLDGLGGGVDLLRHDEHVTIEATHHCKGCDRDLPRSYFHRHPAKGPGKLQHRCKACRRAKARAKRAARGRS